MSARNIQVQELFVICPEFISAFFTWMTEQIVTMEKMIKWLFRHFHPFKTASLGLQKKRGFIKQPQSYQWITENDRYDSHWDQPGGVVVAVELVWRKGIEIEAKVEGDKSSWKFCPSEANP